MCSRILVFDCVPWLGSSTGSVKSFLAERWMTREMSPPLPLPPGATRHEIIP